MIYPTLIILKEKMKYITLLMLICLFFTVRLEDPYENLEKLLCTFDDEKECKLYDNCCWVKQTNRTTRVEEAFCAKITKDQYDYAYEKTWNEYDDISIECSGKYLYVASLLMLLFVF